METNRRKFGRPWLLGAVGVLLLAAAALGVVGACTRRGSPPDPAPGSAVGPFVGPAFEEVTARAGVCHTYRNGQYDREGYDYFAIIESLGGGAALIDYDNDGLLDIFITGGGYFEKPEEEYLKDPSHPPKLLGYPCKLYHNLGDWKFEDVTAQVGLDKVLMYTHGAAVADYDRDGWPDLLVTGWDRMALYHNEPDGKGGRHFVEVTEKAGLMDGSWSTSAAWADFDGDGFPDLYVCHYVNWGLDPSRGQIHPPKCSYDSKTRDVCPPKQFVALPHKVYHNNGDGTFTDVSKEAGLRTPRDEKDYDQLTWLSNDAKEHLRAAQNAKEPDYGKGLGVIAVDVNGDGKPDVYVANDTVDNFLYINRSVPGHIRFEEIGMASGTARDDRGVPDGSMGVDAADYDNCGRPSLWVVNYQNENHCLYHNECKGGREFFLFATMKTGISAIGQNYVGWGTQFFDLDHDGWLDLFIANGHAIRFPSGPAKRAQRPVLMYNTGASGAVKFVAITDQGGPYFLADHCSRGVAFGDLDNDGKIDMVLNNLNEPTVVLHNVAPTGQNHWLGVELVGKEHRCVVGAKVVLDVDGKQQTRYAKGGGSYASANDPRHVFGLGPADHITQLTVIWRPGQEQHYSGLAVDRYWRLVEDKAEAEPVGK